MKHNVAQKLIKSHLVEGEMVPGNELGLKIDQTLTQDDQEGAKSGLKEFHAAPRSLFRCNRCVFTRRRRAAKFRHNL